MSVPTRARQIALVTAAALGLTTGMGSTLAYSLGTLMPYLTVAKGWERGDISFALTVATLGIFFAGPLAGRVSDRHGAASTAATSLIGYALLLIAMTFTLVSIEYLWAYYFVIAVVGAGSTPIVLLRPITAQFVARRGLAIGFALAGAGLAGFWLPIVIQFVAARYGWQGGYYTIAGAALIAAPIVWAGLRDRVEGTRVNASAPNIVQGLTVHGALRTRRFWLLAFAGTAMAVGVAGLIVHLVPLLIDLRMSPAAAAGTASLIGLASVAGRLCVGYLLDRLPAGFVAVGVLGLSALGVLALRTFGVPAAPAAAILLGFAAGSEVDLVAYLTARYFGQRAYGAIFGWQYSIFAIGYGFSPFVVGRLHDVTGDYDAALLLCMAAMGVAALTIQGLTRQHGAGETYARLAQEVQLSPIE